MPMPFLILKSLTETKESYSFVILGVKESGREIGQINHKNGQILSRNNSNGLTKMMEFSGSESTISANNLVR